MSISVLAPSLPRPNSPAPAASGSTTSRERRPREPGLAALAVGLLALVSSLHPLWVLASVVLAVAGAGAGLRALLEPGERRFGAIGLIAAVAGLAVASVTLPATLDAVAALVGVVARMREGVGP